MTTPVCLPTSAGLDALDEAKAEVLDALDDLLDDDRIAGCDAAQRLRDVTHELSRTQDEFVEAAWEVRRLALAAGVRVPDDDELASQLPTDSTTDEPVDVLRDYMRDNLNPPDRSIRERRSRPTGR